jgi:hypothetical protein
MKVSGQTDTPVALPQAQIATGVLCVGRCVGSMTTLEVLEKRSLLILPAGSLVAAPTAAVPASIHG